MFVKNVSKNVVYIKNKIVHPDQILKIDSISDRYKSVLVEVVKEKQTNTIIQKQEVKQEKINENQEVNKTSDIPKVNIPNVSKQTDKENSSVLNDIRNIKEEINQLREQSNNNISNSVLNDLLQQILNVLKNGSITLQTTQTTVTGVNNEQIQQAVTDITEMKENLGQSLEVDSEINSDISLDDLDPILANLLSNSQR